MKQKKSIELTMFVLILIFFKSCESQNCDLNNWISLDLNNARITKFYNGGPNTIEIYQIKTQSYDSKTHIPTFFHKRGSSDGRIQLLISKMNIESFVKYQELQSFSLAIHPTIENSNYIYVDSIMTCTINFNGECSMKTHNETKMITKFEKSFFDSSYWIQMETLNNTYRCSCSKDKKEWIYSNFEIFKQEPYRNQYQYGFSYSNNIDISSIGKTRITDIEIHGFGYCGNKGTCKRVDYQDSCVCDKNWNGRNCEQFSCYGLRKNDTNACSGNGKCVGHDNCQCFDNSKPFGKQCEKLEKFEKRECFTSPISIPFASGYNLVS